MEAVTRGGLAVLSSALTGAGRTQKAVDDQSTAGRLEAF